MTDTLGPREEYWHCLECGTTWPSQAAAHWCEMRDQAESD